ncbi:MAG: hypothetical protein XU10_C0051G0002 [Chloroflexi bacterium CSP1-4]|nr:MAG: hypothetical protein XU10_C0051G0002 [Chloroflexi bacterium CSP1-4]
MRPRSMLALVVCVVAVLLGACGGGAAGGGGGGPEQVERGVWYPIELGPPCAGSDVPQVTFGGSQWTIALVRDSTGHLLKAADLATDPRGQVRLLSDDLAEYEGQTGVGVTGTLHRQTDTPAPCG